VKKHHEKNHSSTVKKLRHRRMKMTTEASGQQRCACWRWRQRACTIERGERRVGLGLDRYHFEIGKMTPQLMVVYIGYWKLLFHPATVPIKF
jgi:hypothetical protein